MAQIDVGCLEERVEDRRGFSDCRFLIAAPHDLATPFLLPGEVDVFIKPLAIVAAVTKILKLGPAPREFYLPAMPANSVKFAGHLSKGFRFEVPAGVLVPFEVYVAMTIGPQRKIAAFAP